MTFWTYTYQHTGPEYYDTEMDKEFLLDLRELRCLYEKEKEIKQLVISIFFSKHLRPTFSINLLFTVLFRYAWNQRYLNVLIKSWISISGKWILRTVILICLFIASCYF